MASSIIRTDKWVLAATPAAKRNLAATVREYRAYCRALSYVVMGHWAQLTESKNFCSAVERLIHPTRRNSQPKYSYFHQRFYKFPSYLRRAAIEFVKGQVSSYLTRYRAWQSGQRKHRQERPPQFNPEAGCYPALYGGNVFQLDGELTVARIKVWNSSDWVWQAVPIASKGRRHLWGQRQSPTLVVTPTRCQLAVPFRLDPNPLSGEAVCAVDVGINTLATASIVRSDGTVAARRFFHPAVDIDRRDKLADSIRRKARKTKTLHPGFCRGLYRRMRHLNRNIAEQTSRRIADFAAAHGASVVVFEDLQGWKPKAGRKRSGMKKRFHHWLHRSLVERTAEKFRELGGSAQTVYPRGTSSWAFDGSGRIRRDKRQYELATFPNGKRYNADLNASYNIGARYWAHKLGLTRRKDGQVPHGRSPCGTPRMPATLSLLWDGEAAHGRAAS